MATDPRLEPVAPMDLARRGADIHARIPLDSFTRVASIVLGGDALSVELAFARDAEGRCRVRGNVEGELTLQCQSCLEPVRRRVRTEIDLCVVGTEAEAQRVEIELNPFVVEGGETTLVAIVEDDLLLSLPARVCEDVDACPNRPAREFGDELSNDSREGAFAALRELKRRKD